MEARGGMVAKVSNRFAQASRALAVSVILCLLLQT